MAGQDEMQFTMDTEVETISDVTDKTLPDITIRRQQRKVYYMILTKSIDKVDGLNADYRHINTLD